ncbi:translocator [Nesidiocoris tenuis]|uniref:Translocator n=1 Tax=Nesidiocoris tenuis TaxID=355587 RepID=A0ABN7AX07_9HEMI|nr:translocator [Nesidiocoris tenuis]
MPVPVSALGAILLPHIGGWAGSFLVRKHYSSWYMTLKKPKWTPPKYAFGTIWTVLYSSMGFASYIVYKEGGGFQGKAALPLAVYGANLAFNWAWTPLFFGYHSFKWSVIDGLLLMVTAAFSGSLFYKVDEKAGLMLIPYLAWLGLGSSFAFYIYQENDKAIK